MIWSTLAVVVTAGIGVIMFNSIPTFLGAAAETLGLDNAQLGSLASANFLGQTLMTIVVGLTMGRFNLRRVGMIAALTSAVCMLSITVNPSHQWMMAMLFVVGLGAGAFFVIAFAIVMASDRATRDIGLCFWIQLSLAAIVVFVSPAVIAPRWGMNGVVIMYSALFVVAAVLTTSFGRYQHVFTNETNDGDEDESTFGSSYELKSMVPLIALAVFFLGTSGVWAFLERIGDKAGLSAEYIGAVLMVSLIAGALSSLVTVFLENRLGLRIPIAVSCAGIVAAVVLLARGGSSSAALYALAAIGFQCAWVLTVNYISASIAWLDHTGKHSPLLPAFAWVGIMVGPYLTGIISGESFVPAIIFAIVIVVLVASVLTGTPLLAGARSTPD